MSRIVDEPYFTYSAYNALTSGIQVKCENGQLIITPDVDKAQEQEAKTAFMDEEIKKLKIRYQNEKEEITAKYVAEQSAGCYGKKA